MPTIEDIQTWRGGEAIGADGEKLGTIEDIYLDRDTGDPEWVALRTGMFGTKLSFAPLAQGRRDGDAIVLPYDKGQIKDAPRVDADGQLSQEEEAVLYRHYGLDYSEARSDSGLPEGNGPVGRDTSGPTTDDAMTRSEEELRVSKTSHERGRARLRKYVVTEKRAVPKERVRLDKQTVTDEQTVSEQVRKEQIDTEGVDKKSGKKRRR